MNEEKEIVLVDEMSKAELLAQVISGQGKAQVSGIARPVLLRLPIWDLAELDAMAQFAGKSRNAMAIHLLQAGIEEVRRAMDNDTLADLNAETTKRVMAFQPDHPENESVEA